MKYILTFITVLVLSVVAFFGYRAYFTSYNSVRTNIAYTDGVYSWDQWCDYKNLNGTTSHVKIGRFSISNTTELSASKPAGDICKVNQP